MKNSGIIPSHDLSKTSITTSGHIYWNLTPAELIEQTLIADQGHLADNGALCVDTGAFTGRSPRDKFVVMDALTEDTVWWGDVNHPISEEHFVGLLKKAKEYLADKDIFVRDVYTGADPKYRISVRVINMLPWQNLFVHNMFICPEESALAEFVPDWTVIAVPDLHADPIADGTRAHNFPLSTLPSKLF